MRIYTYHYARGMQRVFYKPIVDRCRISLARTGALTREGGRWRAGTAGHLYQNITVQQLVAKGIVRIDGDVARLA